MNREGLARVPYRIDKTQTSVDRSRFVAARNAAKAAAAGKSWQEAAELWAEALASAGTAREQRAARLRLAAAQRRAGHIDLAKGTVAELLRASPSDLAARRELGRIALARRGETNYWEGRKDFMYLRAAKTIATRIGRRASSVLDIGSNGTPILEWFPDAERRCSVDLRRPYRADGIESYAGDFLEWQPDVPFHVATCLQVLEHVPDVGRFAQKILEVCEIAIVSVPYKWPEDQTRHHIHDPVDEEKMLSWFLREPNYSYIATEIKGGRDTQRMVSVYDVSSTSRWRSINESDFLYRWSLPEL